MTKNLETGLTGGTDGSLVVQTVARWYRR